MEMSGDSSKYAYGMAIAFIMFVFFALNISHNLKLSTRTIEQVIISMEMKENI